MSVEVWDHRYTSLAVWVCQVSSKSDQLAGSSLRKGKIGEPYSQVPLCVEDLMPQCSKQLIPEGFYGNRR